MNFFEHQARARSQTTWLVGLYVFAVALIIAALYFLILALFLRPELGATEASLTLDAVWRPELALAVTLLTLTVVGIGTLFKVWQLSRGGGAAVAESLGGILVPSDTQDFKLRRLMNTVEEMALASGVPVPPVYLMAHEQGINAFAAGFDPSDAVIGVTQGCIDTLNRDELQGVMAHEFSHILNGDMRLNLRLIGVLNGILIIALTGSMILRSLRYGGRRRYRSSSDDNKGAAVILALGFGLWIIGYVGVLVGRLIKSAVSRQREFLADASAVQFTRNPDGIAGALAKIGALSSGSRIDSPEAEEASHMFFSNALTGMFINLFATHPPLTQRITRIHPNFDFDAAWTERQNSELDSEEQLHSSLAQSGPSDGAAPSVFGEQNVRLTPDSAVAAVGNPGPEHIAFAHMFLASISPALRDLISNPYGARAVVYALLLSEDKAVSEKQLSSIANLADATVSQMVFQARDSIAPIARGRHLLLIDLCLPALRQLSSPQYETFKNVYRALIEADQKVDLFELALESSLRKHLERGSTRTSIGRAQLSSVPDAVSTLLSAMALISTGDRSKSEELVRKELSKLQLSGEFQPVNAKSFSTSLEKLDGLRAEDKKILLETAVAISAQDNHLSLGECEFLRACFDGLRCPVPPFIGEAMFEGQV